LKKLFRLIKKLAKQKEGKDIKINEFSMQDPVEKKNYTTLFRNLGIA